MALEERVEPAEAPASAGAHAAGHPSPKEYVRIGLILFVLTALEIAASYTKVSGAVLIPSLFVLAIVKFALVVLWFMHLRFDSVIFRRLFVTGIVLAGAVYLIFLSSLHVME